MSNTIAIKKQDNIRPWICAVLLFVISYPMWFWSMSQDVITVASLLLLFLAFDDISHNKKKFGVGLFLLFLQIIFLGRYFILPNTNIFGYIMVLIRGIGYATIFLCSVDFWKKTVDCFIKLLALLLIPALIEHVMVTFLGLSTINPGYAECPINPEREYDIYVFNAYLVRTFDVASRLRFFAFFDEPGVLGNLVMVLLYIQKFNLRKWYNIVLLISGILTFSMAFYAAVAAYYIIFGNMKLKIAFVVVVLLATYYFYNNDDIYQLVFGRFEFEDGELAGYNREIHTDFVPWLRRQQIVDYLFWGYSPRWVIPYAASWKWAFALYGIIPSLIYLFTLLFSHIRNMHRKDEVLLCLILVAIIWIQRPFIQLYFYAFLLAIPFIYFSDSSKKRINNVQRNE